MDSFIYVMGQSVNILKKPPVMPYITTYMYLYSLDESMSAYSEHSARNFTLLVDYGTHLCYNIYIIAERMSYYFNI